MTDLDILRRAMVLTLEKFDSFGSMDFGIVWSGMHPGGLWGGETSGDPAMWGDWTDGYWTARGYELIADLGGPDYRQRWRSPDGEELVLEPRNGEPSRWIEPSGYTPPAFPWSELEGARAFRAYIENWNLGVTPIDAPVSLLLDEVRSDLPTHELPHWPDVEKVSRAPYFYA